MNTLLPSRASSATSGNTTRRDFLRTSAMTLGGLALPTAWQSFAFGSTPAASFAARQNKSVIFIYLSGGPSHLDMYDMKPNAPSEIRGEFRPIRTNVPGLRVCEHLPLHAKIADKFAIVNGVEMIDRHSPAMLFSGYADDTDRFAVVEHPAVDLRTLSLPHGDWDTHGKVLGRELSIFAELRDKLPAYDAAIHRLITGIFDRGLDQDVLVIAGGEFGRTPWINKYGGRDHWAPCGSLLFAGGGLKMGQTIGNTGPIGEREQSRSRPYSAQNVLATIYRHLGIDPAALLDDHRVIEELI